MESLEPLINLLVVLTVLSVMAERFTNLLKLKDKNLRMRKPTPEEERDRAYAISGRSVIVGIILAVALKADLFDMLNHLEAPWETLGWVQVENYRWMRSPASATPLGALWAIAGSAITGLTLGFGSKFWHDILGAIYELRDMARKRNAEIKG